MRRDDAAWLLDILIAAKEAKRFTMGLTRDAFFESKLHQQAIIRSLEVIGEAAHAISETTRKAQTKIPWDKMIGMRNQLIHEYFDVDLETVWDTALNDLPDLITMLEPLVPPKEPN